MNERDDELDKLLAPIMKVQATDLQIRRWQSVAFKRPTRQRMIELSVAAALGFLIGASVIWKTQSDRDVAGNFDGYATIESVYSKGY